MRENLISYCNRITEYSFYAIFFFVPLVFTSSTSELFELNKIWLTFGLTLVIAGSWFSKMILQKRIFIQKTPLDIPIALFLLSQIISTIFSMDQHISLWGYYSRFNGGLFSLLTYVFLYYAFLSNFFHKETSDKQQVTSNPIVMRSLIISLISGAIVALWGLPSHFGYDPTCWLFRGTFDVSCWTDAFQPKIRMFSTLGQPNWMAAYLSILLPLCLAFGLTNFNKKMKLTASGCLLIAGLFYVDIIYTDSQSGFVGSILAIGIFLLGYLLLDFRKQKQKTTWTYIGGIGVFCLLVTFFIGVPITQFKAFTFAGLQRSIQVQNPTQNPSPTTAPLAGTALEGNGGTNSGDIRKNVWAGAIAMWKDNPLFGTGVETFAFAYYKYRPAAHNMTSEWDFLYNKAHNEYLNYLGTTGAFGLGTYLLMIGVFIWITVKTLISKSLEIRNLKLVILSLLAGYCSILVSNFFGFSVVILNIYLFIIPAFVFLLSHQLVSEKSLLSSWSKSSASPSLKSKDNFSSVEWISIIVVWCIVLFQIWTLFNFWIADQAFALAQNYDRIGQYEQGYKNIRQAIALRSDEPTFAEELATSDAVIAVALAGQKQEIAQQQAQQLSNEAIATINQLTTDYPNNLNFLKSQVRVYYTLSQLNPAYLKQSLEAMKKAAKLAPTDAKIWYNLGVLYGQTGNSQKGIEVLQKTIQLKPDYREAYFALGLFYHDTAVDKNGKVIDAALQQKAIEQMQYILTNLNPKDKQVLDTLKSWGAQ